MAGWSVSIQVAAHEAEQGFTVALPRILSSRHKQQTVFLTYFRKLHEKLTILVASCKRGSSGMLP